mgnify:CR=1 FL=1
MNNKLNRKWDMFRTTLELGVGALAMVGTWVCCYAVASAARGYSSAGGEVLLSAAVAGAVVYITHRIMNKVEGRLNERIKREERRAEQLRRACRAGIFTIEPKNNSSSNRRAEFKMFSVD